MVEGGPFHADMSTMETRGAGTSGIEAAGRTAFIVNRHSGTVRSMGEDAVRSLISGADPDAEIIFVEGSGIEDAVKRLTSRSGIGRLIIGGGDGTLASVAGQLAGTGFPLGVLPMGTMNLVAQALGMSTKLDEALTQLAEAEVKPVDAGRAAGRLFLHHVSFGLHPRLVKIRERLGYSSRLTKMLAGARAIIAVLLNPQSQRLSIEVDGKRTDVRTPILLVSNNIYENSMMLRPERFDGGILGVLIVSPMSLPAYLKLALDLLRGRWRENLNVTEERGKRVRLAKRRRFGGASKGIKATVDGELVLFDLPLTLESVPGAVTMLVPRVSGT